MYQYLWENLSNRNIVHVIISMAEIYSTEKNVHVSISIGESIRQNYCTKINIYGRIYYTEIMYVLQYLRENLLYRNNIHVSLFMGESSRQK